MSGHTPGPWSWSKDRFRGGYSGLFGPADEPVVYPQCENDGDSGAAWFNTDGDAGEETLTDANAKLISAAPDLLEALSMAITRLREIEICSDISIPNELREAARAAIAKATGESP